MRVERWLPVPGYEGLYDASDQGRVRSHYGKGRILKPEVHPVSDHLFVNLYRDKKMKHDAVHRIIARTFLGERPQGLETRHIDGDPSNNHLSNLAYGTHSDNMNDRRLHGINHQVVKTHCPAGHAYDEVNTYIYPSNGRRGCRACTRRQGAEYRARRALLRTGG